MENEKMYYIQNGYVGNAILWWGIDSRGYTTDINKAGKYTKEETLEIIKQEVQHFMSEFPLYNNQFNF
jgi:hypothetical protein